MRAAGLLLVVVLAACAEPASATPSPSPATSPSVASPSPSTVADACRIPVWWSDTNGGIHGALVGVPGGDVADAGVLPQPPQAATPALSSFGFYGGTYQSSTQTWRQAIASHLSPDGSQYVYFTSTSTTNDIHVLTEATGADRVVYSGADLYFPIAFTDDGIYLVHAINPRQGAFEKLYRLSPSGGGLQLVPGSDRHMYQYGWVLIADGAAWGIDNQASGNDYIYSIVRLDLSSNQETTWMQGPVGDLLWPMGVDSSHRLYVADQSHLWRVGSAGQATPVPDPGPIQGVNVGPGTAPAFVADAQGEWFAGLGGVWLYTETSAPKIFQAGPPDTVVSPAGSCASSG